MAHLLATKQKTQLSIPVAMTPSQITPHKTQTKHLIIINNKMIPTRLRIMIQIIKQIQIRRVMMGRKQIMDLKVMIQIKVEAHLILAHQMILTVVINLLIHQIIPLIQMELPLVMEMEKIQVSRIMIKVPRKQTRLLNLLIPLRRKKKKMKKKKKKKMRSKMKRLGMKVAIAITLPPQTLPLAKKIQTRQL